MSQGRFHPLRIVVIAVAALSLVPVLSVLVNIAAAAPTDAWAHIVRTVLADYIANTAGLVLGVAVGVISIGVVSGWLVTMYAFPGRRVLEWALILPLAMPAYVMAYAYTDFFQVSGPVQTALRDWTGWGARDYWFPEVRSLPGAIAMFSFTFYPYVYLLARTAFLERSEAMLEAARTLGHGMWSAFFRVSLPMARPALAAGASLALMETLADYGTVAYFGVQTFTTGIYRAWFSMGDRVVAAQLSASLLGFVLLVLLLERLSRGRARFYNTTQREKPHPPRRLTGWRAALAFAACALPFGFGFLLPAGILASLALSVENVGYGARFVGLAANSVTLAGITAAIAVVLSLAFGYHARLHPGPLGRSLNRLVSLGYAVPGIVIAVGVLIPLARFDNALDAWMREAFGVSTGLLLTGTMTALVYAYLVRFLSASLQTVEAGLAKIRPSMDDAARSLGAGPAETLRRVHAPMLAKSLLVGGLIVFVDVMKELPATLVMRPFNLDTLATHVYNLAADERLAEAALPSLAIVAVGLVPLILIARSMAQTKKAAAESPAAAMVPAGGAG
ncbi:MAG TPA: iron ABC transporter permease [Pelomicrobium sp.]|nr:iron ABC transporter permease [Pelomicrobium sp.]